MEAEYGFCKKCEERREMEFVDELMGLRKYRCKSCGQHYVGGNVNG